MKSEDKPFEQGVIARISGAWKTGASAVTSGFFSPMLPLPQVAPKGTPARRLDYQQAVNVSIQPEAGRFRNLRALADAYGLLRVIIETFKDHVVQVPYTIRPKAEFADKVKKDDPRIQILKNLLERPDGEHSFAMWMREFLEEVLVIDAPSVQPVFTAGGKIARFRLLEGDTIVPKINLSGETPAPPKGKPPYKELPRECVAYQQVIKGTVACEFAANELIYFPRNRRTHRLYGYSPVEQVIMLVNMGLRREMHQIAYFTEGNIPDVYVGCPADWTPDQIKEYQQIFDSYLTGNLENRRKMFLGPDGKIQPIHEPDLKNDLDEWIARCICFALNISPTPFVRAVNRATAESAREQAIEEGSLPYMNYVADFWNAVVYRYFGWNDLEFAWQDAKEEDPQVLAETLNTRTQNGTMAIDEAREVQGLDPVEGGDEPFVMTGQGPLLVKHIPEFSEALLSKAKGGQGGDGGEYEGDGEGGGEGDLYDQVFGGQKFAKGKKKRLAPTSAQELPAETRAEIGHLTSAIAAHFDQYGAEIAQQVGELYVNATQLTDGVSGNKFAKGKRSKTAGDLASSIDITWDDLISTVKKPVQRAFDGGARRVFAQITTSDADMFDQVNDEAVEYAINRSAELVGKKVVDGELVDNPDAEWSITETTRQKIRDLIEDALVDGLGVNELKSEIVDAFDFSKQRAEMIARTELGFAHVAGYRAGAKAAGAVAHASFIASEHDIDDECNDAQDDGIIPIDQPFSNGQMGPLYHPNCECAEEFYFQDELEEITPGLYEQKFAKEFPIELDEDDDDDSSEPEGDDSDDEPESEVTEKVATPESGALVKYKFGTTQVDIPEDSTAYRSILEFAAGIDEDDLAGDGRTTEPHITVRYGLRGAATDELRDYLRQQSPFLVTLGQLTAFEPSESSDGAAPLIIAVQSDDLNRINSELGDVAQFMAPTFDYHAHATVAYVKPEAAAWYVASPDIAGTFVVRAITICDRNGDPEEIQLLGNPAKVAKAFAGGWIGVDFDGTLAIDAYPETGPAIPRMVERVKEWLGAGVDVRIVTARVADDPSGVQRAIVEAFCVEHFGRELPVGNEKDPDMIELWDDRAVQVIPDSGVRADGKKVAKIMGPNLEADTAYIIGYDEEAEA